MHGQSGGEGLLRGRQKNIMECDAKVVASISPNDMGPLERAFIEAHHLRSMSTLTEGAAVTYNVTTDFAVLCANCHRMIHRTRDPSDLRKFRELIETICEAPSG